VSGLGPIVLHGGPPLGAADVRLGAADDRLDRAGDEAIGRELLRLAGVAAAGRAEACLPGSDAGDPTTRRIAILEVVAGPRDEAERGAADTAGLFAALASEVAGPAGEGERLRIDTVVLRGRSDAASGRPSAFLAAADLVYLPAGNAAAIVATLRETLAWNAVLAARARGAVLGASGGAANALGSWLPGSGGAGLAILPRVAVIAGVAAADELLASHAAVPAEMALLGLATRTALVSGEPGGGGRGWRVAGRGPAWLLVPGAAGPMSAGPGEVLTLLE